MLGYAYHTGAKLSHGRGANSDGSASVQAHTRISYGLGVKFRCEYAS